MNDRALYGTSEPPQAVHPLRAGRLSADLVDGGLRNIRYDGIEAVRAIAYLVRDENWGTYAPAIANLCIDATARGFRVAYDATCRDADGRELAFSVTIDGGDDGRLRFGAHYRARTPFSTCRNGFCVLHPIDTLAGRPVAVEHSDGAIEEAVFPALIAPWQPFKDIRALTHPVADALSVSIRFEGDTFEMEDQRNWSDASYKTYVRPLALPWPYLIAQGEEGKQAVDVRIESHRVAPAGTPGADDEVVLSLADSDVDLPQLGLLLTPEDCPAVLAALDALRALAPQVLLCHFDPTAAHGLDALRAFADVAAGYPCRYVLECVVPGIEAPELELVRIAALLEKSGFRPEGVAVSPSVDRQSVPPGSPWPPCPPLDEVYRAARAAFPGRAIGGGTFSYFTELNRKPPPLDKLDWVTHATNPIVHAADDISVMQTLEALPHITRSCRALIGDLPYRIGPVTLAMRGNPYGTHTVDNPDGRRVTMAAIDPRSRAQFGAAWLLGYAAQIAPACIDVLTLGPLTGPRGLIDADNGTRYPAFEIAAALARIAGEPMIACRSTAPDRVLALGASDAHGPRTLWIANLSATRQICRVDGLDASSAAVELPPYGCVQLDWDGQGTKSP
jgi:hypothetical protein